MNYAANALAHLVLATWPLLCVPLFLLLRPATAVAATVMIGTLLLPERLAFDAPLIPPLGKYSITTLSCLAWCVVLGRVQLRMDRGLKILAVLIFIGALGTSLTNQFPRIAGPVVMPGLTVRDALADTIAGYLQMLFPMLIGASVFRTADDIRQLLRVYVIGAILYLPLVLFEIRFSPQLNVMVYGFFAHDWMQMVRHGGFRPLVFLTHGLILAKMLQQLGCLAALLGPTRPVFGLKGSTWAILILLVVVASRSLAPVLYGVVILLAFWLFSTGMRMKFGWLLMGFVAIYPVLRITESFPTDLLVSWARYAGDDRAQSLQFRFDNESMLLKMALEQPIFGWGEYGRQFVVNAAGRAINVVDSAWIITFGKSGLYGLAVLALTLALPLRAASAAFPLLESKEDRLLASGIVLVLVGAAVDMLINFGLTLPMMVLSGALVGLADQLRSERQPVAAPAAAQLQGRGQRSLPAASP